GRSSRSPKPTATAEPSGSSATSATRGSSAGQGNDRVLLTRRWLLWPQAVREVYPGLVVRPRSEWTDAEPAGELVAEEVRFLLVHHTAGNTQHSEADVPAILGGI